MSTVTDERRPLTFVAAAAWTVGMLLFLQVAVSVTEAVRPGALGDLVNVTFCHVLAYSTVTFAMLRVHAPETRVRRVVGFRAVPILALVLAGAVGAGVYPALSALDALVARRFPPSPADIEAMGKLMTAATLGRRVFLGVALLAIMPIAEEIYFRGLVFGGLRRGRSAGLVILGSAFYFALARGDQTSFASVVALGVVLGWMRDRTGSIVPTFVAQSAFSAVAVIPILRGRDPVADDVYPRNWLWGALVIALLAAALIEWATRGRRADGGDEGDDVEA